MALREKRGMTGPSADRQKSALRLEPLTARLIPALEAFHRRLESKGGPAYRFGTDVRDTTVADGKGGRTPMQTWVAVDGDDVRGGILLQHLEFDTVTGRVPVLNIQLPLSEGTVDRQYAHVGMWLIRSVQRMHANVYAVGMGGMNQPLPQLLQAMKWTVAPVPFLFFVHRPSRFLRQLPLLRQSAARSAIGAMLSYTGIGSLGMGIGSRLTALSAGDVRWRSRVHTSEITHWEPWATQIWNAVRDRYSLAAARDASALMHLYPPTGDRTLCFRVDHHGSPVGWFALLVTPMRGNEYFGDLTVGTVLDAQALPGFESDVVAAARTTLHDRNADISVTNQLAESWQRAFRSNGYWSRPSNFLFACSPALRKAAGELPEPLRSAHVTRGDGDGRIHL
jgi:hypothetical protein